MIHQYKLNGCNIVLDVYSGSVHLVDEVAYDIIALFETTPQEEIVARMLAKYGHREDVDEGEIRECLADIQALKDAGKLFSQDLWRDVEQEAFEHTKPVLKAMCLHVAHTCNLNCDYCFASQGNYHGDRALMSFEVGKQALDFLIANSGSRVNLEVDFFGGEPLMNWQVVKDLVAYARSQEPIHHKNFRFTLTTNGILLDDEVTDFCNKEIHNVVLSLDGRKEVHDRLRKNLAGLGSYDIILPKFQRFVQRRGDRSYYMRGTFTHDNVDFTNDIFHMADLGFTELSMEPVVSPPGEPWALTEEDLPKAGPSPSTTTCWTWRGAPACTSACRAAARARSTWPSPPGGSSSPATSSSTTRPTPWGMCGRASPTPLWGRNSTAATWWQTPTAGTAGPGCTGGCAANAYHASGDINGTYDYGCQLFKKRVECAIMIKAVQAQKG